MDLGGTGGVTERRQRILRATDRLLRRYGPSKTTIADIAREADVAVGTVYLEFDSKDAIIEELSTARYRAVLEAMRAAAGQSSRPYRDRLRAAFDARVAALFALAGDGEHACDLLHCHSRAVQAAHARFVEDERALVAELLRSGARDGELDVVSPDAVARAVLRAYASFSPPWLFMSPREEVDAALRAMHDLVLYGLVHRARPA